MTVFTHEEASVHVRTLWSETLGIHVVPGSFVDVGNCEDFIASGVRVHGDWEGMVILQANVDALTSAIRTMYGAEFGPVSRLDQQDVALELANITCGAVRATLPGDCRISLPELLADVDRVLADGFREVAQHGFLCDGSPVFLRILEAC